MIAPPAIAHAYLLAVGQATAQTELTLAQRAVRPPFAPSETGLSREFWTALRRRGISLPGRAGRLNGTNQERGG